MRLDVRAAIWPYREVINADQSYAAVDYPTRGIRGNADVISVECRIGQELARGVLGLKDQSLGSYRYIGPLQFVRGNGIPLDFHHERRPDKAIEIEFLNRAAAGDEVPRRIQVRSRVAAERLHGNGGYALLRDM